MGLEPDAGSVYCLSLANDSSVINPLLDDHFSSFALRPRFKGCFALGAGGFFGGRTYSAVS